jgi:hypothetical protein
MQSDYYFSKNDAYVEVELHWYWMLFWIAGMSRVCE